MRHASPPLRLRLPPISLPRRPASHRHPWRPLLPHRHLSTSRRPLSSGAPTFPLDPRLNKGDKVVVAMSGGVDSSVALRLLAEHDLDLSAVFMRNWASEASDDGLQGCEWEKDWEDVRRVCEHVGGVPVRMVDLSKEYWLQVFEPAIDQWAQGITPNPDVACNREIKFGALLSRLSPLPPPPSSAAPSPTSSPPPFLATGHYAQIIPSSPGGNGSLELHACPDPVKDQSYFLSAVGADALERSIFPLGHLHKAEVKALARKFDLPTATRTESMGICFVGRKGKRPGAFPEDFLSQYIPPSPGPVLTSTKEVFDRHQGLHMYTVGQRFRKAGLRKDGERWYVAAKARGENALVVVEGASNPLLFSRAFNTRTWDWVARCPPPGLATDEGVKVEVKIMSVVPRVPALLHGLPSGEIKVTFSDPPGAVITPGQICVAYQGTRCLGGGEIVEREWEWPTVSPPKEVAGRGEGS